MQEDQTFSGFHSELNDIINFCFNTQTKKILIPVVVVRNEEKGKEKWWRIFGP